LQPQQQQLPPAANRQPQQMPIQQQPTSFQGPPNSFQGPPTSFQGLPTMPVQPNPLQGSNFSPAPGPSYSPSSGSPHTNYNGSPKQPNFPPSNLGGPPQIPPSQYTPYTQPSIPSQVPYNQPALQNPVHQNGTYGAELPPLRPVFGVSLEDLFNRDGSAVPMVVSQCLQAVDLFGLEVEGIYRLSGTSSHITKLRSIFDNGKQSIITAMHHTNRIRCHPGRFQEPGKLLP